jgi:hypothetical protein
LRLLFCSSRQPAPSAVERVSPAFVAENQEAEINATGIAPTDNRESAILKVLPAGHYTAIVRGKTGPGVGLVEAYRLAVP